MFDEQLECYLPPDKTKRPNIPLVSPKKRSEGQIKGYPDESIANLISQVSQENLSQWIQDLSAFHTRHTKSIYLHQVAIWLAERFKEFGYTDVMLHGYRREDLDLDNVVCTKPGSKNQTKTLVLCGHYDCRMEDLDDDTSRAPGADDNASGIAVILELARLMARLKLEQTVQFVAFSGEEQGMWGSTAYAKYIQSKGIDVHRLINLDQIGYSQEDMSVIVERDLGNDVLSNDQPSQDFADLMAQMAADYSSNIKVQLGPIYASDYMPFEARGYVTIGAYEGEGNPHYHKSSDTPETVSYEYLAEVARMVLATIAHEADSTP